jgi:hypothetical protein
MNTFDQLSKSTFGTHGLMMDIEPAAFAVYTQILEDTFGEMDDVDGYPELEERFSCAIDGSDTFLQEDERDVTGIRDNTRRRLRRIHTHRRRSKRH